MEACPIVQEDLVCLAPPAPLGLVDVGRGASGADVERRASRLGAVAAAG